MPKRLLLIVLTFTLVQMTFGLSIRDIQESTEPGSDNTYPSLHVGETVTINTAVIGAKGFNGSDNMMFLFDLNGGAWNGILINANDTANIGNLVNVTGTVEEIDGTTILTNADIELINAGPYTIPAAINVTVADFNNPATAEMYESCLVKVANVSCSEIDQPNNEWVITTDNETFVTIGDGFYTYSPVVGQDWGMITGIVNYEQDAFRINPRDENDFVASDPSTSALTLQYEKTGDKLYIHLETNRIKSTWNLDRYSLVLDYNTEFLEFNTIKNEGTITTGDDITYSLVNDVLNMQYIHNDIFPTTENARIMTFVFDLKEFGVANANISAFNFQEDDDTVWNIYTLPSVSFNYAYSKKDAYLSIRNDENDKNIFNVDLNEKLTIKYGFKPGVSCKAIVRIYDIKGRLVATPISQVISGLAEFQWNGRDKHHEKLDVGTYICHVEIINRTNGDKYTTDQPIVIAGKLK